MKIFKDKEKASVGGLVPAEALKKALVPWQAALYTPLPRKKKAPRTRRLCPSYLGRQR